MSIFFVVGKPGGGKSYYGVKQIVDEIMRSNRYIVTNIELLLPEIRAYCHEQMEDEVDLTDRVRVLTDAEAAEFWKYEPGRDFDKRKQVQQGRRMIDVPDFEDRAKRGCLYVIDEVHVMFGAREWQNTGTDCTFFLSQHRKLRTDVILITQHPDQVDKALRRLAQDYVQMRNLSREPVFGFRVGSVFRWSRSLNSPTGGNPRVFESGFLKLDTAAYGKMYDTMQGVGIQGRVTPTIEAKGRSKWWLVVPVAAVIFLVVWGPSLLSKLGMAGVKAYVGSFFGSAAQHINKTNLPASGAGMVAALNPTAAQVRKMETPITATPKPEAPAVSVKKNAPDDPDRIYMVGYAKIDGHFLCFLSDGRMLDSDDARFERMAKDGCRYDGVYYPLDEARRRPAASVDNSAEETRWPAKRNSAVSMPVDSDGGVRHGIMRIHWQDGTVITKSIPQEGDGVSSVVIGVPASRPAPAGNELPQTPQPANPRPNRLLGNRP